VPPLVAFGLLCRAMSAHQAAEGVLSPFPVAAYKELSALLFYRVLMGTNDVAGNAMMLLRWTGYYAAFLVPGASLALACRKSKMPYLPLVWFVLVGVFFGYYWQEIGWSHMAQPLPLVMLIILVALAIGFLRAGRDIQRRQGFVRRLSLAVLATALLAKIVLNTRIMQYGFVLAMPATLLFVVALWDWIPAAIIRHGGAGGVFRAGVLAMLLAVAAVHLHGQARVVGTSSVEVQDNGRDAIRTGRRGVYVNEVVAEIHARATAGQTLAVFPEGVMVNYLCRMPNPTGYINFMPPEMILFGEQRMLEAFGSRPPDFILLVPKNMAEQGYRGFGLDYGRGLYGWIGRDYRPVAPAGRPSSYREYGFLLLERANAASDPAAASWSYEYLNSFKRAR
jgi:hypothetical protein